jgi:Cu+-exporting ATPase
MKENTQIDQKVNCFHCGDAVKSDLFQADNHDFCCLGCQSVYLILSENSLDSYYKYNQYPGKTQKEKANHLEYLDEEEIAAKLIDFKDTEITKITFFVPSIHCSSCIWLLENLYKINPAILFSRVDFTKKQANITFKHHEISLRSLVKLLITIGYEPIITLQDVVKEQKAVNNDALIRKIAVAGFCFGNVMMLSFPEYLGISKYENKYAAFFGYINLTIAFPAMLYSGRDYFISAWKSLKQKQLNLDVPLALGIFVLFLRSAIEILTKTGAGFSDTLCGLIFFLLIGKWIQERTFYHLSFERDYRSYFPVAVTKITDTEERPMQISDLEVGDRILIRNNEIIPADAILLKGDASIDFSFVTGESIPTKKVLGEVVYAGGRQLGQAIELEIVKSVSQSYLTTLWNNENFEDTDRKFKTFANTVSKYFTIVLIGIAVFAAAFWMINQDSTKAWAAFTAVLIIACPCALALSSPFTLSAALSIFDKHQFFIKNTATIEKMAKIDKLIFDKTGTLSAPNASNITFSALLNEEEKQLVASLCRNSNHPLSIEINKYLQVKTMLPIQDFNEQIGFGLEALINGHLVKIGNAKQVGITAPNNTDTRVYVKIDNDVLGFFSFEQQWRENLSTIIADLDREYSIHLISGDRDKDKKALSLIFNEANMHFNQIPQDKLDYIKDLQSHGKTVCMIGDGLNDAGALRQANVGIAVSDDINTFSPGCDAILSGSSFGKISKFFTFSKDAVKIIHRSFVISLLYNVVGISFAIQGTMSPLFAAILMPVSTVTIISFTSLSTHYFGKKLNKI